MKTFMETLRDEPFVTLFCWFMMICLAAIAVTMWVIPFSFGYEWWMIPINLVVTAACAFGVCPFWDSWKDFSTSYYD